MAVRGKRTKGAAIFVLLGLFLSSAAANSASNNAISEVTGGFKALQQSIDSFQDAPEVPQDSQDSIKEAQLKAEDVEAEAKALENPQFTAEAAGSTAMEQHASSSKDQASSSTAAGDQATSATTSREDLAGKEAFVGTTQPQNPVKDQISAYKESKYRILAVVSTYKDDIGWILAEDHGGNDWRWRVPTELYQVADIGDFDCKPVFPGIMPDSIITPAPSWPKWAADWALEKCAVKRQFGFLPGSVDDSYLMAQQDAGLAPPTIKYPSPALEDISGSGVISFEKLTPLPLHLVPNKASEGLAYLSAIVNNYKDLPDLMLFLHGHGKSWHTVQWGQDWTLDRLASLPPRNLSHGYMQLGCIELDDHANRVFPNIIGANHWSPASLGPRWHESFAAHFQEAWIEHFREAFGQPLPPNYISAACCASFAVTKQAILSRPKSFYEGIRKWVLDTPMERYWVGAILEFTWHMIFTNLAVYDPPKSQCLCELYDICVGSAAA